MSDEPHPEGTILKYPYLWRHQRALPEFIPKDRTACLIMKMKGLTKTHMVILAISDMGDSTSGTCIEIPEVEKRRAGLNEFRPAYIHLAEYNVDQTPDSLYYNPAAAPLGRLSKPFTAQVARALVANIRGKRASRADRQ